jgi:toxin ParE1/3/4
MTAANAISIAGVSWRPAAGRDRLAIMAYIALDNPRAALELDTEFGQKVAALAQHPALYRPGRIRGTREMVVRSNYVVVYRYQVKLKSVEVLRVLHVTQQWPAKAG